MLKLTNPEVYLDRSVDLDAGGWEVTDAITGNLIVYVDLIVHAIDYIAANSLCLIACPRPRYHSHQLFEEHKLELVRRRLSVLEESS